MDISTLVNLTSRAWSLNILAKLHTGIAGRQAPLIAATGAGRTAFTASLDHLVRLGLIERNPGHGHPLRPEFRLTPAGIRAARIANAIIEVAPDAASHKLLRRAWTVPILAVAGTPYRFSALKLHLTKITDRALSSSLHQLEEHDWLHRDIETSGRMPYPTYRAKSTGFTIHQAIGLTS